METNERMSKRFWLLGLVGLISAGLLVACGSKYDSSSQGLVLVGSQGSNVIQTFSFNLNSGHAAGIGSSPATNGQPGSMAVQPNGKYAFLASTVACTPSLTGNAVFTGNQSAITAYNVNSDGTLKQQGSVQYLQGSAAYPPDFPACGLDDSTNPNAGNPIAGLAMDAAGKFLFVALEGTAVTYQTATASLPSEVLVFSIGSDATLTPVQGNYTLGLQSGFQAPNFVALAATPTVFPGVGVNGTQNSVCSAGNNPPTSQYLYAVDSVNYVVWEFSVDTTTGALGVPAGLSAVPSFATDAVPAGIAVDPCDRFMYVSSSLHNKISAYTICTTVVTGSCALANGALLAVPGSPFPLSGSANGAGPLVVDPFGNYVYVVGTLSNTLSGLKISPISGSLTALNPATVATGSQPKAIAIRADDNWLFVTNYGSATVSQYSITPATGNLSLLPTLTTDNNPFGVAVK